MQQYWRVERHTEEPEEIHGEETKEQLGGEEECLAAGTVTGSFAPASCLRRVSWPTRASVAPARLFPASPFGQPQLRVSLLQSC